MYNGYKSNRLSILSSFVQGNGKRYFKQRYGASYSQQTRCIPYIIYGVIDKDIFTMESLILAQDER